MVEKPSFRTPKLRFQSTISPFPRPSSSSVSFDYTNHWRGSHMKSTCHGDRKLCSTRCENSSPGIGIAYVTAIQNRHFETVDRASFLGIPFRGRNSTAERNRHFDPVGSRSHSEIYGPAPKFHSGSVVAGCRCDAYKHPFAQTGITFRSSTISRFPRFSGISTSLDCANRWWDSHMESACHGDRKLCSSQHENSSPGRKFSFARRSEPPARPQFGIGTSTRSAEGRIWRFPLRCPNFSSGAWLRAADAITYGHPFAQTSITFRSVIRIAYKTAIRNRHSEALVAPFLC
ncbi:hypothetical protein Taro_018439 [Colocasia esculenta]|uniref:Uncharacterized protein n=1 Tax=Colocasia esculenta TaxID=4460 RepID=A0A843UTV4_COLES|nr:hypothetical protein [Colocasia esculenta]